MDWDLVFRIANGWAMLCWLVLLFGPRNDGWLRGLFYGGVALLALSYAVIMPLLLTNMLDPGPTMGGEGGFSSLNGVKTLLSSNGGATIAWIHFLAFDLFVGSWIARNAATHGYNRWLIAPILFLTFMAGPIGLTLYLLLRLTCRNAPDNATLPR